MTTQRPTDRPAAPTTAAPPTADAPSTATPTTGPPPAAQPAILCEGLVRIFVTEGVEVQALQGLDLQVDHGDLVALVGASGSGKSTLLSILSGLDRPTAGRAVVAGTDVLSMDRRARTRFRRHTVGFVWQQTARNLLPYLTAAQNVAVPMVLARTAERATRAEDLLDLLGVADCRDRLPAQMSGGQQQRVAIATAVANRPEVLLADEPTGELDEDTSADVLGAIRHVTGELGMTTLIVTHDPTVADHVRRTVQIRDGRTSTEVLRRATVGADGAHAVHAEEFAVLDRVGRLQLPREVVESLGLRDRVRLGLETDHARIWPADAPPPDPATPGAGTAIPDARTPDGGDR